jgi:hypothetical protein
VSAFSSVFGRKALKVKRVWNFTKVYMHKFRRQCLDFSLKCLRLDGPAEQTVAWASSMGPTILSKYVIQALFVIFIVVYSVGYLC